VNLNFKGHFSKSKMQYSLNLYGPDECVIEPVSRKSQDECLKIFKSAFMSRCERPTCVWNLYKGLKGIKFMFIHASDGYGFIAIWNQEHPRPIRATISLTGTNFNFSRLRFSSHASVGLPGAAASGARS